MMKNAWFKEHLTDGRRVACMAIQPTRTGDGVVEVFRRRDCEAATQVLRLHGLDPAKEYELTNFDIKGTTHLTGKELIEKGIVDARENKIVPVVGLLFLGNIILEQQQ